MTLDAAGSKRRGSTAGGNARGGKKHAKQGTLDLTLGLKPLPSYFVLRAATGPSGHDLRATWETSLPKADAGHHVLWRSEAVIGKRHISLVEISEDGTANPSCCRRIVTSPECRNVSLLKSLLQKAIRRQDKRAATWAAASLAGTDITALLRRLPVIVLEDAMLHSCLPPLVWMMVANSKGWTPSEPQVLWLVNASADLCQVSTWDVPGHAADGGLSDSQIVKRWQGDSPKADLLLSMNARLAFGGMPCDMDMIRWAVSTWSVRFAKGEVEPSRASSAGYVSCLPVPSLPPSQWVWQACDFHCSNIAARVLSLKLVASTDTFTRLMWDHGSSINTREATLGTPRPQPSKDDTRRWLSIEKAVQRIALQLIHDSMHRPAYS